MQLKSFWYRQRVLESKHYALTPYKSRSTPEALPLVCVLSFQENVWNTGFQTVDINTQSHLNNQNTLFWNIKITLSFILPHLFHSKATNLVCKISLLIYFVILWFIIIFTWMFYTASNYPVAHDKLTDIIEPKIKYWYIFLYVH